MAAVLPNLIGDCTVSLANVVPRNNESCCDKLLRSHVIIIIRGKQRIGNEERDFHGYYHIGDVRYEKDIDQGKAQTLASQIQDKMGNLQGVIGSIIVDEGEHPIGYKIVSNKEYNSTAARANTLIANIHAEQQNLQKSGHGMPYQKAGCWRYSLLGGNEGHSCLSWAVTKLARAGFGTIKKLLDGFKAVPEEHTSTSFQVALYGTAAVAVTASVAVVAKGLFSKT